MANMLYNGVELPALPETNQTYKYAIIVRAASAEEYYLRYCNYEVVFNNQLYCKGGGYERNYHVENGEWVDDGENYRSHGASMYGNIVIVWTNTDILTVDDGSVYFAASEPVDPNAPAEPETPHITTSSGDGFALYNGVKLPNVDNLEFNHSIKTSIILDVDVSAYAEGKFYYLHAPLSTGSSTKFYLGTTSAVVAAAAQLGLQLDGVGVWTESTTSVPNTFNYTNLWADEGMSSVGDASSNPYYGLYSDPVPLDGMTVIEWDGITDGNSIQLQAGYKIQRIGDYLPTNIYGGFVTSNTAADSNRITIYGSPSGSYSSIPDSYTAEASIFENDSWLVSYIGDELDYSVNALLSVKGNLPMTASVTVSEGLWVPVIGVNGSIAMYTPLVAYRSADTPSEPTYDRTAFLSGMAMGLTGKGYPAGANGHMSYNGVELADISSIWTDKSNHVFICRAVNSYFAIVSTVAPYQDSVNGGVSLSAPFYFKQYGCFTDEAAANEYGTTAYTWTFYQEHSLDEGVSNFDQTVIWTSTDIRKDSDGSIFLAASEPFPAGGIGGDDDFTRGYLVGAELRRKRVIPEVKETATMLYNGVELPNINEVWTDKESYPYATILGKTTISLILHNPEFRHKTGSSGELCLMTESGSITGWVNYSYNASTASWKRWSGPFGGQSPEFKDSTQPAIWSNYDVLNTDGSVYLAASDPVPVT